MQGGNLKEFTKYMIPFIFLGIVFISMGIYAVIIESTEENNMQMEMELIRAFGGIMIFLGIIAIVFPAIRYQEM